MSHVEHSGGTDHGDQDAFTPNPEPRSTIPES